MQPFTYARPASLDEAFHMAQHPGAMLLAGGTTMVDLMRGDLSAPSSIVDIGHLTELAGFDTSGPVLRFGGNLLQRTRCSYFRDGVSACNKRVPGSGCAALDGATRDMALFGTSDQCIATYPGDWGNALAAFDTSVEVRSAAGARTIPFPELHVAYGKDPAAETTLRHGEIITAILVQATPAGRRSTYLKVRDRQSYAYAVVSATVALEMDGDTVRSARVSLGGVATKPWRSQAAEAALQGVTLNEQTALAAGHAGFADAKPLAENGFKIELGARAVARAALVASRRN